MSQNEHPRRWWDVVWVVLRPIVSFVTACVLVVGLLSLGVSYAYDNYIKPADPDDATPIAVTIKRGSSISSIARQLKEAGIIRNKGVFQYLADFMGKGGKLQAGEYELNKSMSLTDIMEVLEAGNGALEVMRFKLIEGLTCEQMAASLVEQKVFASPDRFLALCKDASSFVTDYPFLQEATQNPAEGRLYQLEGYLFPDTYEIYVGSTEEVVIGKLLDRFNTIYGITYINRAEELDLSMDEVVTLASIIQKEGKKATFDKVSAVFHNRLTQDMALGSDVTIQYALKVNNLVLTQSQLDAESPYNTYTHKGLPVGPIASPGNDALMAALYPDDSYVSEKYLYFTLTDPETGELAFSKTLEEHNALVEQYRPLWQAYDDKQAAATPTP